MRLENKQDFIIFLEDRSELLCEGYVITKQYISEALLFTVAEWEF